jgi:hypothetical protein
MRRWAVVNGVSELQSATIEARKFRVVRTPYGKTTTVIPINDFEDLALCRIISLLCCITISLLCDLNDYYGDGRMCWKLATRLGNVKVLQTSL